MACSTKRRRRPSRPDAFDRAGQATVELALVLPLLAVFTVVIAQFTVVARDQLAMWQAAREISRAVALAPDPTAEVAARRSEYADTDVDVSIDDAIVTVSLARRTTLTIAGFDYLRRSITLRARVSMALEPPVAFGSDVVGDEFPARGP